MRDTALVSDHQFESRALLARTAALALIGTLVAVLLLPRAASAEPAASAHADLDGSHSGELAVGAPSWLARPALIAPPASTATASGGGTAAAARSAGAASASHGTAPGAAPRSLVPSDGTLHRVEIGGGRRIAISCRGTGTPTVILEHGLGYDVDSDSWATVQAGVAKETRVCRYDRAFVGDSDDGKTGRSMPDLAADLAALLRASLIPGPYIVVGHSFGGLSVRYFALLYPKAVVGMVLVEGSAPYAITNLDLGSERLNRQKVFAQLKQLKSLGHIPLIVITRGIGGGPLWRAAQEDMVELSTSGRQVIATESDHWIQLRQPDLVSRQILAVLHTIRRYQ